jgi:hypothetical protein
MSSSAVPNIHVLTKEIEERVKAARPSHLLYNPSNEWVEIMVNGNPIQIPPDGKAQGPDGRWMIYDGTAVVRDVYGVDPEALRKARASGVKRPNLPADRVVLTALQAISHAVRKRYQRGIVFLSGDPIEDKKAKADAKATWIEWRREQAEKSVTAYRQQTSTFHADARNAGQPAPPMPDHVQEAQEFLDDYRLGTHARKRFACPLNCGYYTDDQSRIDVHVRASHPLAANSVTESAEEEPSKPHPKGPEEEEEEQPEGQPEPDEDNASTGTGPRRPGRPRRASY